MLKPRHDAQRPASFDKHNTSYFHYSSVVKPAEWRCTELRVVLENPPRLSEVRCIGQDISEKRSCCHALKKERVAMLACIAEQSKAKQSNAMQILSIPVVQDTTPLGASACRACMTSTWDTGSSACPHLGWAWRSDLYYWKEVMCVLLMYM